MSITNDKLEILIGKFLDGEISPGEQRVLDDALQRDERARELLDQLRTLRECSREMIVSEVLDAGAEADDVLERAWQRNKKRSWRRIVIADGHLRFAAGLAAGLILGLLLHFIWVWQAGASTAPRLQVVSHGWKQTRPQIDGSGFSRRIARAAASDLPPEIRPT